ncbi:hypothetical protein HK104_010444, partial [Borealophlyctis nickersoniae]
MSEPEPYIIKSKSVAVDEESDPLGKGFFGVVRKGIWCGMPVAVKVLKDQALTKEELKEFTHEARTNRAIPRHKNILAFIGIIREEGHYALIMELMPKGSLFDLIVNAESAESLTWDERRRIARDIACGMLCLHEANVFHCDLKSLNVLLAEDLTAKLKVTSVVFVKRQKIITEQGVRFNEMKRTLTCVYGDEFTALCIVGGSRPWSAPELSTFTPKYTNECDVFSYGITLTELFTMAGPYGINFKPANLEMAVQLETTMDLVKSGKRPSLPSDIPDDLSKLVEECWAHNPKQRPPFSSIVARLDGSGPTPVYHSARDELYFTGPSHLSQSSRNNHQHTTYHTPVTASGSGRSAYSTPSSLSPFQKTETLEDKIDSETDHDVVERLKNRLKNCHARQEDLRAEKKRVQAQIDRLFSAATHLPTPTATPPKSVPTSSSGSAASTVNPTDRLSPAAQLPAPTATPPKSASTSSSGSAASRVNPTDHVSPATQVPTPTATPPKSLFGRVWKQIGRLPPDAAQPPTPTATPPKSASASSSESAASIVKPTYLEKLYERGRALDPDEGWGGSRNHSAAFEWYHKAAIAGHPASQNAVGWKFLRGDGVEENVAKGFEWVQKAADQGYPEGQRSLGRCYFVGLGVAKDEARAVEWYKKAVEQGYAGAQNALGYCYQHGLGVGKDERKAVEWYKMAAEQGDAPAQYNLGACYENGMGVPKKETTAVEWYKMAAEQGFAKAQNNLGRCYGEGSGVGKDEKKAVKWYKKAAEQGHAPAQYNLGACYENGMGVPKKETTAVEWYKMAAEQGHADAQTSLGRCYETGFGVGKDERKAAEWYKMAAEQGNVVGQFNLEGLLRKWNGCSEKRNDGGGVVVMVLLRSFDPEEEEEGEETEGGEGEDGE